MVDRSRHPDLDDVIDRTVRDMTSADPLPGFDRRVMRRLEQPARRPLAWPRLAVAGAAVLATIIVIAIALRDGSNSERSPLGPQQPPAVATGTPDAPPPVIPAVPTAASPKPSTVHGPRTAASGMARGARVVIAASIEEPAEPPIAMLAALDPPSALAVQQIEQRPVNMPDITMPSIEIEELNVQPLRPLDERREE